MLDRIVDRIVPEEFRERRLLRQMERLEPSSSGFALLLGVRGDYLDLAHHNVFFSVAGSEDYRAEFDYIFGRREPAPPDRA